MVMRIECKKLFYISKLIIFSSRNPVYNIESYFRKL